MKEFTYYQKHHVLTTNENYILRVEQDDLMNRQITVVAKGTTTSLKVEMLCGGSTVDLATVTDYCTAPTGGKIVQIPFPVMSELRISCNNAGGTGVTDISVYGSNT